MPDPTAAPMAQCCRFTNFYLQINIVRLDRRTGNIFFLAGEESINEAEKIAYINITTKPGLKQKVIAALRSSGETAIDELVLEDKYLNVGRAVLKSWISQKL
jgi:hypothetical protein